MDPYDKKVIGPHDPIARDMAAHRQARPGGPPTLFRGSRLGELDVEEAYIYPPLPNPEEAGRNSTCGSVAAWSSGQASAKWVCAGWS